MTNYEELLAWCQGNKISLHEEFDGFYTQLKAYNSDGLICGSKGVNNELLYKEFKRYIIDKLTHNETSV